MHRHPEPARRLPCGPAPGLCVFLPLRQRRRALCHPAGDGIEVRYPLDFRYLALTPRRTSGVDHLQLDEGSPRDTARQPSIVLRMVGEGERLWDIAKAYGTTMDDIVQANALAEDALPAGELLLIPKKR